MTRAEFFNALNRVILITLALMVGSYVLLIGAMIIADFKDAFLHFTLATVFTLILAPVAAFPLVLMSDRLRVIKDDLEGLLRLDGLTELPNRRAFFEMAEKVFERTSPVTLMMVDVDYFKQVNDNYGHDAGDRALRSVAQSIQRVVAQASGAGVKFAARIGGEEFAVLVEGLAANAADQVALDLVETVERSPVNGDGQVISITVSVGLAHRRTGDTPGMVLRAADNACYRAKRLGRNQWRDAESLNEPPPTTTPAPALTAA